MSEEKKGELHPIIEDALDLAYEGAEPIAFTDWAIDEIKQSLEQYFGKEELFNAVANLLQLGVELGENNCPTAALQIIEVVTSATNALNEFNKKRQEQEKVDLG